MCWRWWWTILRLYVYSKGKEIFSFTPVCPNKRFPSTYQRLTAFPVRFTLHKNKECYCIYYVWQWYLDRSIKIIQMSVTYKNIHINSVASKHKIPRQYIFYFVSMRDGNYFLPSKNFYWWYPQRTSGNNQFDAFRLWY